MEALSNNQSSENINVFLIGNNPIELSGIYEKLKQIKNKNYITEIGFDLKGLVSRIKRFSPSCILIDDNLERLYIKNLMTSLSTSRKTKDIPITVIKNSNFKEGFGQAQEYVLKQSLTSESLSTSILNSIKLKKMQLYFMKKIKKNKSRIISFLDA